MFSGCEEECVYALLQCPLLYRPCDWQCTVIMLQIKKGGSPLLLYLSSNPPPQDDFHFSV